MDHYTGKHKSSEKENLSPSLDRRAVKPLPGKAVQAPWRFWDLPGESPEQSGLMLELALLRTGGWRRLPEGPSCLSDCSAVVKSVRLFWF